ncbi:hypothetical protein [Pseudomonas baetica]|nr:hypothetical protein [Pseudomonas baetica]MDF9773812.1 hypothetical protein [Pseudomonas baetica]
MAESFAELAALEIALHLRPDAPRLVIDLAEQLTRLCAQVTGHVG